MIKTLPPEKGGVFLLFIVVILLKEVKVTAEGQIFTFGFQRIRDK